MIKAIRRRLELRHEGGFTLVEVVVAMSIFMIISAGILHTMLTLLSITRDSRVRQVAGNLAAQEIDLARSASDIFALNNATRVVELNNDTFTVHRTTSWVNAAEELSACGAGGGTLRYKQIKVEVEWQTAGEVRSIESDTLLNPSARINDPDLGTILVIVTSAVSGEGVPDIPVKAVPIGGGATLNTTTDEAGCAYFLKATPATYNVSLSSPAGRNFVDPSSSSTPLQTAGVVRGEAATVPFNFDESGDLRVRYDVLGAIVARNLTTTLLSTRDPFRSPATSASNPRTITVAAFADGYTPVAGDAVDCVASDPAQWPATSTLSNGSRVEPVAALGGAVSDVTVPAGAVQMTQDVNRYIFARSTVSSTEGHPGCEVQQVLRFDRGSNARPTLILPYGSWVLESTTSSTATSGSTIPGARMALVGNGAVQGNVVTVDPRVPVS
ncbi:MAG: prepilin-type N-terminal cleavage/methylation domain-containing protein [Salinibacterium sp.]|nr:prepilin-type N-terminal cleavage/methylation domain-containing protein [Salinibacterium sp.]MBF0672658.1 prepilin-type N-terminal cleavage/methylation domain-containing protein [Salinibacterium sp.]